MLLAAASLCLVQVALLKTIVGDLRHELTATRSTATAEQQRSAAEASMRLEAEGQLAELRCAPDDHACDLMDVRAGV